MLPMKTGLPARALKIVLYLTPDEVQRLCEGCRGRQRDRDALLILVLFQTGLRISEALGLTVGHLSRQPGALEVLGKGSKVRLVACPAALSHRLKAYAFDRGLGPGDRLFPVGRKRAWVSPRRSGSDRSFCPSNKPQAGRDGGGVKKLPRQGHHAVH